MTPIQRKRRCPGETKARGQRRLSRAPLDDATSAIGDIGGCVESFAAS